MDNQAVNRKEVSTLGISETKSEDCLILYGLLKLCQSFLKREEWLVSIV